jgi:hypothetical protein
MSAMGSFASLRPVRLRSGLGTIPDISADDCRANLSPQSEPRASGRAGVSFTGQSIGGRNGDT